MKTKIRLISLLLLLIMVFPFEGECQNRKRAKTKAKTTTVSKKSSNTKSLTPKTSAEARKKQEEAKKEIQLTEQQIKENDAKVTKSLSELGKLDQEIDKTQANIRALNVQLQNLNKEIGQLESGIKTNESQLELLRAEYLKAVKKMRVTKKNKSSLAFIFSSKSMSQAMRRMRYLKEFSAWRGRQTEEINGKIADLRNQKEALAKAKEEQQTALALQKNSENKLAIQHKQQEALVAELQKNGKALADHLKRKQAEATELGNMVSRLIAEEQRKAEEEARRKAEEEARKKAEEEARLLAQQENDKQKTSKATENKAPEKKTETGKKPTEYADARKRAPRGKTETITNVPTTSVGGNFQEMKGKLPYPSTGSFVVTSRFGRQHLPDLPDVEYDNPGIDAETDAGASARAVFKGKVSGVYLLPGYNTVVIVNHGNYYTVYGNISSPSVKIGDPVESGSSLGTLALNDEDRNHSSIHFEVWKNREKLNPQEWLR